MRSVLLVCLIVCATNVQARHYDSDYDDHYNRSGAGAGLSIGTDGIQFNIGPTYRERTYRRCWRHHGQIVCKDYSENRHYRHRYYDDDYYDRW